MTNDIKQIRDKYQYNQGIRQYSNKHFFRDDTFFRTVNTNEDVERAYNGIKNTIKFYSEIYPLVREDIVRLEKYCGEYEIAVIKVIQCFDICNFDYTANELQRLIDSIYVLYKEVGDIQMRLACQD